MQKTLKIPYVDNPQFQLLCQAYKSLVSYWNTVTNIVSGDDVDNLLTDLIRQSVKPLEFVEIPPHARMLDVGSGAGIPALPLKFARPDLKLTLLEPRRKKWLFLRRAVEELGLEEVEVVRSRVEEVVESGDYQAVFDLMTTRGTGSAAELFPKMEPLIRPGGLLWFYKGLKCRKEANQLSRLTRHPVRVQELEEDFGLIIVQF